jgi:sec-independent protein translocase protein TatA
MRLGFGEILVILVLALLFFGPSKLPALGASLGEAIKGFKKGLNDSTDDKPQAQPQGQQAQATQPAPSQKAPPSA